MTDYQAALALARKKISEWPDRDDRPYHVTINELLILVAGGAKVNSCNIWVDKNSFVHTATFLGKQFRAVTAQKIADPRQT